VDSSATALTVNGGLWILNPDVANTYTGVTSVTGGQLRAVDGVGIPTSSPITLNGGVLEVAGTSLTRTLGTAAGNIQLNNGASGFAAGTTARLVVTLGGGNLTWGTAGATTFAPSSLVLGSSTALGEAELTNNINFGTAARTVTVNTNGNTGTMVTAGILSGVISGGAGGTLTKAGGGVLILGNDNTYVGDTTITSGNLVVTSIGNVSGTTTSSLGASGGKVVYNPGDSDLNGIFYVGPGETSTRGWTLSSSSSHGSTTRLYRIDASGSGALILSGSLTNTVAAGAASRFVTLELRGASTQWNQMNMVLSDSTGTNTPKLNVSKNDGGVWVLNPSSANLFTGSITSSGGLLGLTANGIGSASGITVSNGGIFAFGSALSTAKVLTLGNNANTVIAGSNSLTFTGGVTMASGDNGITLTNSMEPGAVLTIASNLTNSKTSSQTLNFRGTGSTVWNGVLANPSGYATSISIQLAPEASFTFAGAADTYSGTTSMSQGRLILAKTLSSASSGLTFSGGTIEATADATISIPVTLSGDPATFTGSSSITLSHATAALTAGTGTSSRTLVNTIDSGKSLIIAGASAFANTGAITLTIAGSGATVIQGAISNGTSASNLTFSGSGTLLLSAANVTTGALTANRGTVTLSGANGSWKGTGTSFAVNAGGTLVLDNATNSNDRLLDAAAFNLMGGTLSLVGNATTEAAGALKAYGSGTIAFSGTGSNTLTFASLDPTFYTDVRSALNLVGVADLGVTNKVKVTAVAAGFAPRVAVGADFATYVTADGFKPFSAYAAVTDINASAAGDVLKVTSAYSADDLTSSRYLGALAISDASSLSVGGSTNATLTLSSGAILAAGGSHTVSVPRIGLTTTRMMQTTNGSAAVKVASTAGYVVGQAISGTGVSGYVTAITDSTTLTLSANATATGYALVTAASPAVVQVAAGASLNLGGSIVSTQGFLKEQAGSLTLSARQYHTGETTVAGGALVLAAGDNTISPLSTTLSVESGATVDLNGTTQYVGRLSSLGVAPGGGGTITSSFAATLVSNMSAGDRTFGGSITGAVTFGRIGGYTLTLESAQTYTGATYLLGSATSLQDEATLANTSALVMTYATLNLNNNSGLQVNVGNRINDAAPVTLRGSTITYNGRAAVYASEKMGALTVDQGANTISANVNNGSGNFNSAILTFASLTRSNNATLNFTGSNLGQLSNSGGIIFTSPPTTVGGGYLGPWAIANTTDYAAYNASQGVGPAGQGGFAAYEADFGAGKVTQLTTLADRTVTLPAGTTTTGMLKIASAYTHNIEFTAATDVLNLELGGLLRSNDANNTTIGTTAIRGVLASGIGELVVYTANSGTTLTLNAVIQGATKLVKDGSGGLTLTAANTYTLGTVFNRGAINISPTNAGDVVIPAGGLILNGGVQAGGANLNINSAGAIAATNALTINGRSTLTFPNSTTNTLVSVSLNNLSESNPTLAVGTGSRLLLTDSTPVTATSVNASATSIISGGTLVLAAGANTFAIDGVKLPGEATVYSHLAPTLNISSNITGAGITLTKSGNGLLQLSGQNDFTAINVSGGGIVLGSTAANPQSGAGAGGPLGAGAVTMAAGARLLVDNNDRQSGNSFVWAGVPEFDNTGSTARTLTLNASATWLSGTNPTVKVSSPYLTVALLGTIPNIADFATLAVSGPGALVFNAEGYLGNFNATALGNPYSVSLLMDGAGSAAFETLTLPGAVQFDAGIVPTVAVGRAGGNAAKAYAANKVIAPASITNLSAGLIVTNNNGYGLKVSDDVAFAGTPIVSVANATVSNLAQGLTLSGTLSGTGFVKLGAGTVVLTNAANTFSGNVTVRQGIVSVSANGQLGAAGNLVSLDPFTGTAGLRATDDLTFTGTRLLQFAGNTFTRQIEVVGGKTLQFDNAFDLNGTAGQYASLIKRDQGTLYLNAANTSWNGRLTISGGIVKTGSASALPAAATGSMSITPASGTANVTVASTATLATGMQVTGAGIPVGSYITGITSGTVFTISQNATASTAVTATLGYGVVELNNQSSVLQLQGGITVPNSVVLTSTGDWSQVNGLNTEGAVQSVSGVNTLSANVVLAAARPGSGANRLFGFGALSGATLALNGIQFDNITGGGTTMIQFKGAGNFTFSGVIDNVNTGTLGGSSVRKHGSGSITFNAASSLADSTFELFSGLAVLQGAATAGGSNNLNVYQNATLKLDNATTNTAARLGNKPLQLLGGTLQVVPNAAGSTQVSTGTLTVSGGGSTINLVSGGNLTVTFKDLSQGTGATVDLIGTFGTANNKITFATTAPTLTPATTGILSRFTSAGSEFVTYNATTGLTPYAGYTAAANVLSASAAQTFKAQYSTSNSLTGNQTLNALALNSSASGSVNVGGLSGLNPTTLTLTSGAILANGTGTGSTLSVPVVNFGSTEAYLHVASGQTLTVESGLMGSAALTKALPGTLTFARQQFVTNQTVVNAGTLNLVSGGTNTLYPNQNLTVNTGATVDLKNGVQFVASLGSSNGGGQTELGGGTVTNSGTQATLVTTGGSLNGVITGTVAVTKAGSGDWNLQGANTYAGPTTIVGGKVNLQDGGSLSATSAITASRGMLYLINWSNVFSGERVNDAAPITLRGGNIAIETRGVINVSETFGDLTIQGGLNQLQGHYGASDVNPSTFTFGTFTRAGATSFLRFDKSGNLGQPGQINVTFSGGIPLTNNIIGPWAIVDREWASYGGLGVVALGATGGPAYSGASINSAGSTDNVRFTATGTTYLYGDVALGTLNFASQNATTVLNLGGNKLTVAAGGILFGQQTDSVDFSIANGTLTAGAANVGGNLYLTQANYAGTSRTVTIGAVIADNGTGAVRLVRSSGDMQVSLMTLTGANTYTGGTVINSGQLTLGATGTLGSGGLVVASGSNGADTGTLVATTFTQAAGGIIPSQALTMYGNTAVTLAGNNSLTAVTIDNDGGGAPTLTPTGVLTLTGVGGIAVTTSNPATVAVISTGTLDLNANNSFPVSVGATMANGKDVAPWQAGLNISAVVQNGGITKSGNGVLQLSGQSTFAGGVNVTAGALIIGADGSPTIGTPVSGPVGVGTLTMATNTRLGASGAYAIANDVVFGDDGAGTGSHVFTGVNNLTLNGVTTLPAIWNVEIVAPQMTVSIADATPSGPTDVINKSGLGVLNVGNYAGTLQATGGLIFASDGNLRGTVENVAVGGDLVIAGDTAITVNKSGSGPFARNKVLQKANLTVSGNIMSVSNLSGFGLEFAASTSLTGPAHFAVGTATASNVPQGLILSGVVDDGASDFGITKSGPGTLVLSGANTFGGAGKSVEVLNGVLSVGSDSGLGHSSNAILLNVDGSSGVGLRATETFATTRAITLGQANNAFEVIAGKTLTVSTAFTLGSTSAILYKNDNGVLELTASNAASNWSNAVNGLVINAGAVRLSATGAAGLATNKIVVNASIGAALQLAGGITVANPIVVNNVANETYRGGLNGDGQVLGISGSNTLSGTVAMAYDGLIGALSGATLTLSGGIDNTGGRQIIFPVAGTVNLASAINLAPYELVKYGAGALNITAAQSVQLGSNTGLIVHGGKVSLSGLGILSGSTKAYALKPGSVLEVLDNGATPLNNRLGAASNIDFKGGQLNIVGNANGTTLETLATPTFGRGFSVVTITAQAGQQANLVFTGAAASQANAQNNSTAPTGASVLFRGSALGTAAGAGIATIKDTAGFSFNGQSGAAGATTKAILPWALVDATIAGPGTSFATADTGTGNLRVLAANEYSTVNTIAASNNVLLTSGTTAAAANVAPNSLTIEGNAGLSLNPGVVLNLSSGGILVRAGSVSTISGGLFSQTNGFSPLNLWTVGDLTITSPMNGGNGTSNGAIGTIKAGAGTLTLAPTAAAVNGLVAMGRNTMSGQVSLNDGTLKLGTGLTNAFQANNFLSLNGGTLDLNGTSQMVYGFFGDATVAGAPGVVTSSAGTGHLLINNDNTGRNFAGSIQGAVKLTRSGQNTLNFYSDSTYTGATVINGGNLLLRDGAALSATSAITVSYGAGLYLENAASINNSNNRVNDAAPITLRGGLIELRGRAQTATTETMGAIALAESASFINSVVGGTGVNSADLSFGALTRSANATVNFTAATAGQAGSSARVQFASIGGTSTATVGGGLTNGIIGGWATIGTSDFATYVPGLGVLALGGTGAPAYAAATTITASALPTDNIKLNTGASTVANDLTVNSLATSNVAVGTINIAADKTLTIGTGGLLSFTNTTWYVGAAVNQGYLTSGGSELLFYTQGSATPMIRSVIKDGASAVTLVKSGANTGSLAATNTYTGGTVVNQGTLNIAATGFVPLAADPTAGVRLSGGTMTTFAAGAIAAGNTVTLRGTSALNYFGDNSVAGLVFNNLGGTSNPTVRTFATNSSAGLGSTGVLTIGVAGIVATSENVTTTSIVEGRIDFGPSANTIDVAPISVNGVTDVEPLRAALALQAIVGSDGGITKTGNGVLQLNAQAHFSGGFTVAAGGLKNGVTNAGSRLSRLTLAAGTRYDLNNINTTWGSLAGSGDVFSSTGAGNLQVGFDGTSSTFSGRLQRLNDALNPTLTKMGAGVLTLDSAQDANGSFGQIVVGGGTLKYAGDGKAFVATSLMASSLVANTNGTLQLDNSGTNVANRLGLNAAGTLYIQGGKLVVAGNAAAATTESLANLAVQNGGGRIELAPDDGQALTLAVTTLGNANGHGALVIGGITGAASAAGVANLTITTPALIGGQGAGANGTTTMSVRHDILADASVSGLGTGFLVKDSVTGNYRALASNELNTVVGSWAGTQNAGLSSSKGIVGTTFANSLTISGNATLSTGLDPVAFGKFGPNGGLLTQSMSNASAILVLAGATGTLNVGALQSTSAGTTPFIHVVEGGTLNVNAAFGIGGTAGLLKADGGVLNLNDEAYFTGTVTVDGGTLNLNAGSANTLALIPGGGAATVVGLSINGSTAMVDLKNNAQAVGALASANTLPGGGGQVTNTGASVVNLTSTGGGTFGGTITGALNFVRSGNNTTLLTAPSTYAGKTTVRGGVLQLRDGATIASTAGLELYFGTLNWDNFGLNPVATPNPVRVAAANAVTMQGGTFQIVGAGSTDTVVALNTVTASSGSNWFSTLPYVNEGSTVKLTIGNLVRTAANKASVVFNGYTTNNSTGTNTLGGQGLVTNSNVFLTKINGTAFTSSNLSSNLIGGWAVADGSTFATYSNTFGVVQMGMSYGSYSAPDFTGTDFTAATTSTTTANYNDATDRTLTTGVKAANSVRLGAGTNAQTVTLVAGTSITLGVGLITNSTGTVTIDAVDASNTITGTGTDLYVYLNQGTTILKPAIAGTAALVSSGGGTLRLQPTYASNAYSGGTYVNAGTLNLQAASGFVAVPGDLFVRNATVTYGNTVAGQIAATANLSMFGGAVINLPAYSASATNTLASITFLNEGGAQHQEFKFNTPTGTGTMSLVVLTSDAPVTATNHSLSTVPYFSTGDATRTALQFSAVNPVITVNAGLAETGLNIGVPITQHANMLTLTKAGAGMLALTSAESTFTTGVNLAAGSLMLGANSTGSGPVTKGPLGVGTLLVGAGTTLLSDGTARSVANAVIIGGDFTFGGLTAGNGVTLSGAIDLGASGRTITVTSPAVTSTLSGPLSSTATGTALTKSGPGVLVLSSTTSNLGGAGIIVANGILKLGANGAIPVNTPLTINAGAGFDLGGYNFDLTTQTVTVNGFITNSASSTSTIHSMGASATDVTSTTDASLGLILVDNYLANASSKLGVTKAGLGTLTFTNTTSLNSGNILVVAGKVTGSADNTFSPNAPVVLGNATTATLTATLDTGAFNQAVGGLQALNTNASGLASVLIGSGKTLTVNGNITLGLDAGVASTSNLTATGGAMNVTSGSIVVSVNQAAVNAAYYSTAKLDVSGLSSFTTNVTNFNIGVGSTTTGQGVVLLSNTANAIAATTLQVGHSGGNNGNGSSVLTFGTGTNVLNVDTINVGFSKLGGTVKFASQVAASPGTLTLANKAGTGGANVTIGSHNGTATGAATDSAFDLRGHTATVSVGTLALGLSNNTGNGTATGTFYFDGGTMAASTLNIGSKSGTGGTGAGTGILNISSGDFSVNASGSVTLGANLIATGTASGTINLSGGTFTVPSAATFALASTTTAGGTSTGVFNITGGVATINTTLGYANGAGTENTTLSLSGGTLDMAGNAIGSSTATVGSGTGALNLQSGTLRNVGQINNGAAITKTTAGTLTLDGTAAYTGVTTVAAGTLVLSSTTSSTSGITINGGTGTVLQVTNAASSGVGVIDVKTGATTPTIKFTIDGGGTIALPNSLVGNSTITTTFYVDNNGGTGTNGVIQLNGNGLGGTGGYGNATVNVTGANGYSLYIANLYNFAGALGTITFNPTSAALELGNLSVLRATGTGTFVLGGTNTGSKVSGIISDGSGTSLGGLSAITKSGTGTWTLTGANSYSGTTAVSAGILAVGHATGLGTDAAGTTVADGAELRVQGGITVATEAVTLNGTGFSGNGALRNFSGDNALGGAVTLASDAKIVATAGKLTLTGGVTSADKNLTIGGSGDVTIDTTGLNLGAGSLTMSGTGTLLLSLANTYAGGTTITTGTVKIGNAGALGAGAVSVAAAGTLDLNNLTITNAITLASGATLTGGTLSVADAPKTGTLDVVLTGSTPLEKTDSGRLELTGDNTFSGATSVSNGGTIAVADFGNGTTASPLGITDLAEPAKLKLSGGATLEFTGTTATSTARSFTVEGSAGIAAGAGAAALTFTEEAKIALTGAAPELKLVANNTGATNIFRASLSQADIDAGKGLAKLAIEGAGVWVIGGNVNRFKGDIRVDAAAGSTIGLESGALPAGATLALASGAKLRWEAGNTNDLSSNLSVATGATAKLDLGTNTVVFAGLQDVTGGATLQKEGAGTLKITSAVNAPNVNVTLPANSGLLSVNGTVGNVSLGLGSTLGGAGNVGNVTAGAGSIVSPGNSPGTLTSTSFALFGGSTFEWQIQDAKELTVDPGYDKLAISGALDLSNAASNNRITLKVVSLKGDGNGTELGNPLNFDKPGTVGLRPMVFDFATVGTLNLGANASISDVFTIDVSQFKYSDGSSSDAGLWSINWDSDNHLVTVTAVPEPSTYGFGLGALALAAAAIRRRKRQAKA
jgi:autotransporter-associated beta strand protein